MTAPKNFINQYVLLIGVSMANYSLLGSWDHSVDGNATAVDVAVPATVNEVLVVGRGITHSAATQPMLRVSTDNGSTFFSTSGNYVNVAATGAESAQIGIALSSDLTAAARSCVGRVANIRTTGPRVIERVSRNDSVGTGLFVANNDAITNVRITNAAGANMTGGQIFFYGR